MLTDANFWFRCVIGLIVLFGIWTVLRSKWSLMVVVDGGQVKFHRGVPKAQQVKLLGFLTNEIRVPGKMTVRARRYPNGYLRVNVSGPVDAGTRQRIRNFLITVL